MSKELPIFLTEKTLKKKNIEGLKTIVDDDVYELLKGKKIYISFTNYRHKENNSGFAKFVIGKDVISLHRFVFKLRNINIKGLIVDHINRNSLDNRFENLRLCTIAQNTVNTSGSTKRKNIYKNVEDLTISRRQGRKQRTTTLRNFKTCVRKWDRANNVRLMYSYGFFTDIYTAVLYSNLLGEAVFGEYYMKQELPSTGANKKIIREDFLYMLDKFKKYPGHESKLMEPILINYLNIL